jgi:hypothetical protein
MMQYQVCPVDINLDLMYDPRFTKYDAFYTNEYLVQQESYVLFLLEDSPGYYANVNVPNPYVKQKVILEGWTRPTMPWGVNCEYEGHSR